MKILLLMLFCSVIVNGADHRVEVVDLKDVAKIKNFNDLFQHTLKLRNMRKKFIKEKNEVEIAKFSVLIEKADKVMYQSYRLIGGLNYAKSILHGAVWRLQKVSTKEDSDMSASGSFYKRVKVFEVRDVAKARELDQLIESVGFLSMVIAKTLAKDPKSKNLSHFKKMLKLSRVKLLERYKLDLKNMYYFEPLHIKVYLILTDVELKRLSILKDHLKED